MTPNPLCRLNAPFGVQARILAPNLNWVGSLVEVWGTGQDMSASKCAFGRRLSGILLATGLLIGLSPGVASAAEPPLLPRTRSIQGEVITYYRYALNRAPDVGGFRFWVNAAAASCSPGFGNVPSGIWNSPEFRARSLTRAQRVQTLYQGLLARTGSSSEVGWYLNAMGHGATWNSVVSGFANSPEYRGRVSRICAVHANPRLFVGEADVLLTAMSFSMWLRHRNLRMQVTDPYNWTHNGCSWIPDRILLFDARVCWRHDWGYRNFGGGLRLDRTEARRRLIDDRLHLDMLNSCASRYASGSIKRILCVWDAEDIYDVVRAVGSHAFYR